MVTYTYPHLIVDVRTIKTTSALSSVQQPLHLPIFPILAEQGPVGVPVSGSLAQHTATFGSRTFDPTGPFYQHPTMFALQAMGYQNVYLIRMADDTVTTADMVLLATVTKASIPQYQVDALGARVLDSSGNPIPLLDASQNPITQPGYTVSWGVRALAAGETFDSVATVVEGTEASPTGWIYPILGVSGRTPGSALNRQGFRFYAPSDASTAIEGTINSALYRFEPVTLSAGYSATVSSVTGIFSAKSNDVSLKPTAVDPTTATDYGFASVLVNNFTQTDGTELLGYDVHVYSDNVSTIGSMVIAASAELDQATDPFLINLISGKDLDGNYYQHMTVTADSANVVNSSVVNYLTGGSDGVLSKAQLETLLSAYLSGEDNLEFQDSFQHPFTHFYDSGYSLATKYDLAYIFSLRQDVVVTFSTQDVALPPNTQQQDQSTGAALLARIRTTPESTLYGTGTIRADIYQQCGLLASVSAYATTYVPCTLDRMLKRCAYMSGITVTGTPKGRPYSEVTIFRKLNWASATVTQKQMNWDTALNTVTYAAPGVLFYADLRSVYWDETDLLSDSVYVDYLVSLKHIAQEQWTVYAGVSDPKGKNATNIERAIDTEAGSTFGGRITTSTNVYQTDADLRNGYAWTVEIQVKGNMPQRIWNVILSSSQLSSTSTTTSGTTTTTTTGG